jgi:hypothetical protein
MAPRAMMTMRITSFFMGGDLTLSPEAAIQ